MSVYRPRMTDPHDNAATAMLLLWTLVAVFAALTFLAPFARCR